MHTSIALDLYLYLQVLLFSCNIYINSGTTSTDPYSAKLPLESGMHCTEKGSRSISLWNYVICSYLSVFLWLCLSSIYIWTYYEHVSAAFVSGTAAIRHGRQAMVQICIHILGQPFGGRTPTIWRKNTSVQQKTDTCFGFPQPTWGKLTKK